MNVNDKVEVTLTDRGRIVLYTWEVAHGTVVYTKFHLHGSRLSVQLHTLMNIFGPEMCVGRENVFEDNELRTEVAVPQTEKSE